MRAWLRLVDWWKEWRRKKRWNNDLMLYHLRIQLQEDNRWLAHNRVAVALTERYLKMTSDTWERYAPQGITSLRHDLGLDTKEVGWESRVVKKLWPQCVKDSTCGGECNFHKAAILLLRRAEMECRK